MADIRDLWWAAGRLAFPVGTDEWRTSQWHNALRRSAMLLEPVWPKDYSAGPFTHSLPTVALVLYAGPSGSEPETMPEEHLVNALKHRVEDTVRDGLTVRRHDLTDDSPLSALVRQLTEYHPPLASTSSGFELPSAEQWSGGTVMGESARWARYALSNHPLEVSAI
ncbi:hypothetical protein OK074_5083 [Actinobacteria bacterium OK074]|nr:hypothetical protein OK074_5083 [Actinobacteria bacterium OK074]